MRESIRVRVGAAIRRGSMESVLICRSSDRGSDPSVHRPVRDQRKNLRQESVKKRECPKTSRVFSEPLGFIRVERRTTCECSDASETYKHCYWYWDYEKSRQLLATGRNVLKRQSVAVFQIPTKSMTHLQLGLEYYFHFKSYA